MSYTILVVDDEKSVRSALRRTLQMEGYEIIEAASGEEAVAVLAARPIDLIFSDYRMPGMTGLDFLKIAANQQPSALRIMLTAVADPEVIIGAINAGAVYRFLLKPCDPFELRVLSRLALRHRERMKSLGTHPS